MKFLLSSPPTSGSVLRTVRPDDNRPPLGRGFTRGRWAAAAAILTFAFVAGRPIEAAAEQILQTSRFGPVRVYKPDQQSSRVALVLTTTPDGTETVDRRAALLRQQIVVAVVDVRYYLSSLGRGEDDDCYAVAGEFERLSQVVQSNAGLPRFTKPLLIGEQEGGTLVYIILSSAAKSFAGGVSLDFCPRLRISDDLCEGQRPESRLSAAGDEVLFSPSTALPVPWLYSFGSRVGAEPSCPASLRLPFAMSLPTGLIQDRSRLACSAAECPLIEPFSPRWHEDGSDEGDGTELPVIELPATHSLRDFFVILLSGDGGWATIDKELGDYLQDKGINVVGFDALKYFWRRKPIAQFTRDLNRVITTYQAKYGQKRVVLIGYSLGAEVLPFALAGFPSSVLSDTIAAVLLNPGLRVEFEIRITDWLSMGEPTGEEILPVAQSVSGTQMVCIYGSGEKEESLCPRLSTERSQTRELPGSHHFDGDYEHLAEIILGEIDRISHPR